MILTCPVCRRSIEALDAVQSKRSSEGEVSQCTPSYHATECDGCCGAQAKHPGGRPEGPRMPCGWKCGKLLTAREMRIHFTACENRPMIQKSSKQ